MKPGSGTSSSEKGHKESSQKRISERDRLKFIGFEVFPKEPKELFQSEAERQKLVEEVRARREHHDHLRGDCALLEDRVSGTDRLVLAIASVITILALLLPWYAAYNEIVEEVKPAQAVEEPAATSGSLESAPATIPADTLTASEQTANPAQSDTGAAATTKQTTYGSSSGEEIITAVMARKKIHKEYERLSGLGAIFSIGIVGSYVFSSGFALMLTAVLFIVYTILCIGLPIYNLYGIYGLKGDSDSRALKLKKMLRLNWLPLVIFLVGLALSFLGGAYSFSAAEVFTSLGDGYGPWVYLTTLSWGVFISMAGFILCAAKGAEI